jgi:hypothetical protein
VHTTPVSPPSPEGYLVLSFVFRWRKEASTYYAFSSYRFFKPYLQDQTQADLCARPHYLMVYSALPGGDTALTTTSSFSVGRE